METEKKPKDTKEASPKPPQDKKTDDGTEEKKEEEKPKEKAEKKPNKEYENWPIRGKDDSSDEEFTKSRPTTRFAADTYQGHGPQKPGAVAHDHSLGRDYVDEKGVASLEDFTWNKEDAKPKFGPPGYAYPDG